VSGRRHEKVNEIVTVDIVHVYNEMIGPAPVIRLSKPIPPPTSSILPE
jgi:hypothetical protein